MNERSFETLLYGITASTVTKIMESNNWTEDEAMERFTQSKLYSYLEKEETKVWQYSATMLVWLFNEERAGRFMLPEV
ncbi:MAG: hypothetical protein IJY09_09685 [Lachnospiraceae bacterium]|nr:hypothetical protein [Lachnospiraceae bacterium]